MRGAAEKEVRISDSSYNLKPVSACELSTEVIRREEDIEEIACSWRSWEAHPNSDLDFYQLILRSRSEIVRPHVTIARRRGVPAAMLVGRIENGTMQLKFGYYTVANFPVRLMVLVHGGLLGHASAENCDALLQEVVKSLDQGEADVALVSHLRGDSPMCQAAKACRGLLTRDYFPLRQVHRGLVLPQSIEVFRQQLSPKVRKNHKWQAKKLLNDFNARVRVSCLKQPQDIDCIFLDVEEVAKKTYQRGLGVGFQDTPEMRRRFQLLADKGSLRVYLLYLADAPSAFWIGTVHGTTFHSDFMGYDPAHSKYSIGTFLVDKVIEEFCSGVERTITEIDFGLGDASYKSLLGNREWEDVTFYIFASTTKGKVLNVVRTPSVLINRLAVAALEKTALLPKIKRAWRSLAKSRILKSEPDARLGETNRHRNPPTTASDTHRGRSDWPGGNNS